MAQMCWYCNGRWSRNMAIASCCCWNIHTNSQDWSMNSLQWITVVFRRPHYAALRGPWRTRDIGWMSSAPVWISTPNGTNVLWLKTGYLGTPKIHWSITMCWKSPFWGSPLTDIAIRMPMPNHKNVWRRVKQPSWGSVVAIAPWWCLPSGNRMWQLKITHL